MSPVQNTKNVIVTGASGYIGGTICIELKKQGYTVIGIDRRPLPKHLESYVDQFVKACFTHPWSLEHIENGPVAVIHCAGTSLVGPSIRNPHDYYENNVIKTEKYLDYIRRWSPFTKFIFVPAFDPIEHVSVGNCVITNQRLIHYSMLDKESQAAEVRGDPVERHNHLSFLQNKMLANYIIELINDYKFGCVTYKTLDRLEVLK